MEYGNDELRILTEIDDMGRRRQPYSFVADGQERTVLLDENGQRPRWDFTIEHPIYGKLVCSYYPDSAENQLKGWFGNGFAQEKDGKRQVPGIPMWACTEAGMEYLQRHIQQALHDALTGLVLEAQIAGLHARNGEEFLIPGLKMNKQINQVRRYYEVQMNERLGRRQGHRPDKAAFLQRAYKAYCKAADALEQEGLPVRVTEEELVKHLEHKRGHQKLKGIDVRSFTKQLKKYGFTYAELVERFKYSRE